MKKLWMGVLILLFPVTLWAETLKICVENRDLYPFFFVEKNTPKGVLLDMVTDALKPFGYEPVYDDLPFLRCVKTVEIGERDAMVSLLVESPHLRFPKDAFQPVSSSQRILQIDSVSVHAKGGPNKDYEFFGDIKTLPTPIRITLGDPIAVLLDQHRLRNEYAKTDDSNIRKLMRDQKGIVITTSLVAMNWLNDPKYAEVIEISTEPIVSRSYFLAFPKSSKLSEEKIEAIWNEISKNREDYVYPIKLFSSY